jgi:hypothetical protein
MTDTSSYHPSPNASPTALVDLRAVVARGLSGEPRRPSSPCRAPTPWGLSHSATDVAGDGSVVWYTTPGHGGFKLDAAANSKVPAALRLKDGWYEEDCEAARVIVSFPELFSADRCSAAVEALREYAPDSFTAWSGHQVSSAQSVVVSAREFAEGNAGRLVATAAWGSWAVWVPDGSVGVVARPVHGGTDSWWVVDAARYRARSRHGYVIDADLDVRLGSPPEMFGTG